MKDRTPIFRIVGGNYVLLWLLLALLCTGLVVAGVSEDSSLEETNAASRTDSLSEWDFADDPANSDVIEEWRYLLLSPPQGIATDPAAAQSFFAAINGFVDVQLAKENSLNPLWERAQAVLGSPGNSWLRWACLLADSDRAALAAKGITQSAPGPLGDFKLPSAPPLRAQPPTPTLPAAPNLTDGPLSFDDVDIPAPPTAGIPPLPALPEV